MFRRDFLVRNDLYFEYGILHEDEEFTPRALLKAERVVLTDYVYYHRKGFGKQPDGTIRGQRGWKGGD